MQDNTNKFLSLHDETSGALSDCAAVFAAGCVLAAMIHLVLIIVFGRTSPPVAAQGPAGTYKTYENQMAELHTVQDQQNPVPPPLSYPNV
jgi:hypothetical protein